jgi:hypothetical protein
MPQFEGRNSSNRVYLYSYFTDDLLSTQSLESPEKLLSALLEISELFQKTQQEGS